MTRPQRLGLLTHLEWRWLEWVQQATQEGATEVAV
jgi:hypothetical protein